MCFSPAHSVPSVATTFVHPLLSSSAPHLFFPPLLHRRPATSTDLGKTLGLPFLLLPPLSNDAGTHPHIDTFPVFLHLLIQLLPHPDLFISSFLLFHGSDLMGCEQVMGCLVTGELLLSVICGLAGASDFP